MKSFISKNKSCLILLLIILIFIIIFNVVYYSNKKDRISIEYETLHNGDVIPFNSKIEGNSYLHIKFNGDNAKYYYVSDGTYKSFLSVSYCESTKCLENNDYYKMDSLLNLGDTVSFSYDVLSYNEVFKKNNKEYTGWKVYLKGPVYSTIHEINYLGMYYNLVLVPTKSEKNECLYDKDNIIFTKSLNYTVDSIDDGWKKKNSIYSYEDTSKNILSFKFKGKKGDIVFFDLKNNTNTLNVYLNDININRKISIYNENEQFNNYLLFSSKSIVLDNEDEYILKFEENFTKNNYNKFYYNYTYIKDLKILRPVNNKEDAEYYYVNCGDDILVGSIDEI